MKKILTLAISLFCTYGMMGCSTASPDAGHQAVWVEKPVFLGHGGVDPDPVTAGREYGAFSSDAIDVNMQPQRVDMEFDDMMTKSGVPVSFHVLFVIQVTDSVKLVKNYGVDQDVEGKTSAGECKNSWNRVMDSQINQLVRDTIKQYDMNDIAISQTSVDQATANIVQGASKIVQSSGMPISLLSVNVGRIMPPDAVSHQRIETASQEQRVITMQQTKLAEDARKAAEESRAAADNAYREEMQLSPEQYVQLQNIQMEQNVCGHQGSNCTFFVGGSAIPTIDAGKK